MKWETRKKRKGRTGKASPVVYGEERRDGKNTFGQAAVESNARGTTGKMEVSDHLVYVGKDLGESNGFDKTDEAQGEQLSLWKESRGRGSEDRTRHSTEP